MKKKRPIPLRKNPVQRRSRETVAVIFEAAAQVFSLNGYAATTTDRIAERAGVSIGSLYQYFSNKDAILLGLVERHLEEGQAFVADLLKDIQKEGQIGPEMTGRFIETAIAQHSIDPALHRVLFEEASYPKSIIKKVREIEDATVCMMEEMLRNNSKTRLQNPAAAARMIFTTVEVLTHWYVLYGDRDIDKDAFINELTDMLNRYVFNL